MEATIDKLNRNCECKIKVKISCMWFNDTHYGVTLNAIGIVVKPGVEGPFTIEDMGLDDDWKW